MPFENRPVLVLDEDPEYWRVREPIVYRGKEDEWVIPVGFRSDLASVPRGFRWLVGQAGAVTSSALLHDYLCHRARVQLWTQPVTAVKVALFTDTPVTRRDADGIFRRVMREEGIGLVQRWVMWAAVRVGSYCSGATRLELAQVAAIAVAAVPFLIVPAVTVYAALAGVAAVSWAAGVASRWRGTTESEFHLTNPPEVERVVPGSSPETPGTTTSHGVAGGAR